MEHPKLAELDFLSNKMNVQFDVLGAAVADGVRRQVHR
jgi:hypothetical protein